MSLPSPPSFKSLTALKKLNAAEEAESRLRAQYISRYASWALQLRYAIPAAAYTEISLSYQTSEYRFALIEMPRFLALLDMPRYDFSAFL